MKAPYVKPQNQAQRIANGMAVLDNKLGPDWVLFIDLDTFDITDGSRCVLGQVFGPVVTVDDLDGGTAYDAGLTGLLNYNGLVQDFAFEQEWDKEDKEEALSSVMGMDGDTVPTDAWKRAIRKRQRQYSPEQVERVRKWAVNETAKTELASINKDRKTLNLPPITRADYDRAIGLGCGYALAYQHPINLYLDRMEERERFANAR